MPRPRLAKLDPELRARILGAACAEFSARGYEEASLNAIIEQAGISKGVLYYYFNDKTDLYLAAVQEVRQKMPPVYAMLLERGSSGDVWEDIRFVARERVKQQLEDRDRLRLLQDFYHQAQKPGPNPFRTVYEQERELGKQVLAAGIASGKIRNQLPPDFLLDVTFPISDLLRQHLLWDLPEVTDADLDRFADLVVDILRRIDTAT